MIDVIFEVDLRSGSSDRYFAFAAELRSQLSAIDGFLCIKRFESLMMSGKVLFLSFWRNEAAVAVWRGLSAHRNAQGVARRAVFADYRLRVARVTLDCGLYDCAEAPAVSRVAHHKGPQDL